MNRNTFKQLVTFAIIGAVNTGVDFAILNVLIAAFGAASGFWYVAMKAFSFMAANVGSYFLNTRFTFKSGRSAKSFGSFFSATLVGLGTNVLVAWIAFKALVPLVGSVWAANLGALIATLASMAVNFLLYKYVVFSKDKRMGE